MYNDIDTSCFIIKFKLLAEIADTENGQEKMPLIVYNTIKLSKAVTYQMIQEYFNTRIRTLESMHNSRQGYVNIILSEMCGITSLPYLFACIWHGDESYCKEILRIRQTCNNNDPTLDELVAWSEGSKILNFINSFSNDNQ